MTLEHDEAVALRLMAFWWGCIEAGNDIDGEEPIAPEAPVLHYCAHGTTAIVTAHHLRALARLAAKHAGA